MIALPMRWNAFSQRAETMQRIEHGRLNNDCEKVKQRGGDMPINQHGTYEPRARQRGLIWFTLVMSLLISWPGRSAGAADAAWEPTPSVITATVRDVERLTGWLTTGLKRPTVLLVSPEALDQDNRRRHGGSYDRDTNTILISATCQAKSDPHLLCSAILFHELVHWVQMAHQSWPGTPIEWELEAHHYETLYLHDKQGLPLGSGAPWKSAGARPDPAVLYALSTLLPEEAKPFFSKSAITELLFRNDARRRSALDDGCFLDTAGTRLCAWMLKLITIGLDDTMLLIVSIIDDHPVSVDLRRQSDMDGTTSVIGWWWDKGFAPVGGRIPVKAKHSGVWVRTRGPQQAALQ
jgi:hypothetical protein